MMPKPLISFIVLITLVAGCSSTKHQTDTPKEATPEAEQYVHISMNETIKFELQKRDSVWTATLTEYTFNRKDEKEINRRFKAVQDANLQDLDLFIHFLKIFKLPPQYEIEGWAPNSQELPNRVYSITTFDGDTTRSFSYQDPILDVRRYWQSQYLVTFLTYLENDLSWHRVE